MTPADRSLRPARCTLRNQRRVARSDRCAAVGVCLGGRSLLFEQSSGRPPYRRRAEANPVGATSGRQTITLPRLGGLDADGAGEFKLLDINVDELELRHDGAGTVYARGRVGALSATLGGVGELDLNELTAERAAVRVSGAGSMSAASWTPSSPGSGTSSTPVTRSCAPMQPGLGDVRAAR